MKHLRLLIIFFSLLIISPVVSITPVNAQCAMCKLNAENGVRSQGNKVGLGLNDAILFLLAMPYVAACVVGVLWYKNSKRIKSSEAKVIE